jgi:hypothetical protein
MGVNYGWEKFFIALHDAIASTEPIQKRLQRVVVGVSNLGRDDFPDDESYERFEKLMKGTTILTAKDAGTMEATTSQMEESEASRWLQEAMGIFSHIALGWGKERA